MRTQKTEVCFVETMRGSITTIASPATSPIDIEVIAEASSLEDFRRTGWVTLRGLVHAPAWIDEAPTRGSLRITPRALVYQLSFHDARGTALFLEGIKRPSPLAPLRSMTTMAATLRDAEARVVARGTMRFDLADVPSFALSWIPWLGSSRRARVELDARRRASERRAIERTPTIERARPVPQVLA